MADTPAAIGIRFAFRQYMDLWHCYQLAAMLLLPSTSWRPATAGCGGGFIFRRYLLFLFGGIFGLLRRELLSLVLGSCNHRIARDLSLVSHPPLRVP